MFHIRALVLTLAVASLTCSTASAAKNVWTNKFPQPGANAGEIKIDGTATPDACNTLQKDGTVIVWPVGANGGVMTEAVWDHGRHDDRRLGDYAG